MKTFPRVCNIYSITAMIIHIQLFLASTRNIADHRAELSENLLRWGKKSRKVFLHKIFFSLISSPPFIVFSHTFLFDFFTCMQSFSIVNNFNIFLSLLLLPLLISVQNTMRILLPEPASFQRHSIFTFHLIKC